MLRRLSSFALGAALTIYAAGLAAAQTSMVGSATQHTYINLGEPSVARLQATEALEQKAAANGQVRVIVGLRTEVTPDTELTAAQSVAQSQRLIRDQTAVAARTGVAAADVVTFDYIPFVSMWVNAAQLRRLVSDPNVISIQEDVPGTAGVTVSVPRIGAPTLWNAGTTGAGWAVAVLDTGVDKTHPMFAGKIISEACYSTTNAGAGTTSFCPGGVSQTTATGSGRNCTPASLGQCFHGTHVAGIAAGLYTASNPDRIGVARASKIIAIQVFSKKGNDVLTFDTDWIKGLQRVYALRNTFKIASVNMSLGFGEFTGPCDTQNPAAASIIKLLRLAKIATVVAAMNDSFNNKLRAPACITSAIAVGSTLRTSDGISTFSNHHPLVRHMAPGSDILSAVPIALEDWRQVSGTSMAAPHVAGAYALLRQLRPTSTVEDISAALECTGVPVTRVAITERRINLVQARAYLINPPRTLRNYTFTNAQAGWLAHSGGWEFVPGYLHINEGNAGFKVAATTSCNEGVDITARLIRVGPGPQNLIGVFFKTQFAGSMMSGYLAAYSRTGAAVLRRLDNLNLQTGTGGFATLCNGTATVQPDNFNTIKVITRGGLHSFSVNGTSVCTARDYSYGTGRTGAFAFLEFTSNQNGFAVDSFLIRPVEVVPPAPGAIAEQVLDTN